MHRHVTGFVAAAVLLLLLVLPDSESDCAELDSESPRQLDREPGSDPELERHSMSLSKFSQSINLCAAIAKSAAPTGSIAHFSAP